MTEPGSPSNEPNGEADARAPDDHGEETVAPDVGDQVATPDEVLELEPDTDVVGSVDADLPLEAVTATEVASCGDVDASAKVVERAQNPGPLFWLMLGVGWGIIGFGIHGMVSNWSGANPPVVLRSAIALNVANDALVAPALVALAFACRKLLPRWALVPVQVGLIVSAVVVLYSYPLVGSWGKSARAGSSRLPWNYAHNLAVVLGVVWAICVLGGAWSWSRARLRQT